MTTDADYIKALRHIQFKIVNAPLIGGNYYVAIISYHIPVPLNKEGRMDVKEFERLGMGTSYLLNRLGLSAGGIGLYNEGLGIDCPLLTTKEEDALKKKLTALSDHDIIELIKEGADLAQMDDAKKELSRPSAAVKKIQEITGRDYKKEYMHAAIELATVDLTPRNNQSANDREDGKNITQNELTRIAAQAKEYGVKLSIHNVSGSKSNITSIFEDGSQITQKVHFSNGKVALP